MLRSNQPKAQTDPRAYSPGPETKRLIARLNNSHKAYESTLVLPISAYVLIYAIGLVYLKLFSEFPVDLGVMIDSKTSFEHVEGLALVPANLFPRCVVSLNKRSDGILG